MTDQWHGGQSGPGERWNVNLPAVVGVVFVFLLGVVIWVIATSGGDEDAAGGSTIAGVPSSVATTLPPSMTTSPLPMPVTTLAAPTVAPTAPPAPPPTAPPVTTPLTLVPPTVAPTEPPATQPPAPTGPRESGDLGIAGHAIQRPPCDGGYITILGSAIGDEATPAGMKAVLEDHPGSNYLRTDLTCPSLTPSQNGQPIYVVYLGPFVIDSDACQARSQGPQGAYVRRLSNDLAPGHSVDCA